MITKFDEYINEGVRNLMTPKSEEELSNVLKNIDPTDLLYKSSYDNDEWMFDKAIEMGAFEQDDKRNKIMSFIRKENGYDGPTEEIINVLNTVSPMDRLRIGLNMGIGWIVADVIRTGKIKPEKYLKILEWGIGQKFDDVVDAILDTDLEKTMSEHEMIELLLKSGENRLIRCVKKLNDKAFTRDHLKRAISSGLNEITEFLLTKVEPTPDMLFTAVWLGRPKIAEMLLKAGVRSERAMEYAVSKKNKKMVKLLNQYQN